MTSTLARAMCCIGTPCRSPDACRAERDTQLISIRQAAEIAARVVPRMLCERWKAESFNVDRGR